MFKVERRIAILLLLLVAFTVKAQERENLMLFTDRDLFASGETILLKVFTPADEQSGIVNIDLINHGGKKITGIILEIIDHQADGFINLPDSLSSGTYLLRTSTRTDKIVTIRDLYIANRFSGLPESNTDLRPSGSFPANEAPNQNLQIDGVERRYKQREKGHATIHLPIELLSQIDGNMSVSVAEVNPLYVSTTSFGKSTPKNSQTVGNEGIVIEGTVTNLKTAQPFKNAFVYLSIPDSIPEFQYYITQDDGRFYFQIKKYFGKIFAVVQCFADDRTSLLKINLDNSDSLNHTMPTFEKRALSPELKKSVGKNIDVVTFRKIFNQQEITVQPVPVVKRDAYPYYGIPTETVDPQLFVDLPNFNEISKELLPGVKFRDYNRIPTLQVLNAERQTLFENPPLLLLDGVPIRDFNVIKDMGTKDIDKVDICQSERFYGDLVFPGVVAIYSFKPNYTRVLESNDQIKLNLEVIQPHATLNAPTELRLNDPDLRQALLWAPSLRPEPTITLDFQTSDVQGSFKLVIRGKTKDGLIFNKEQLFEVN
jgi:hypothetical protein